MTKIAELIEIKSGYAKYVNLADEFCSAEDNSARITRYMPIKAHRDVFDRLSKLLAPVDGRVYMLLGSYGTGKSHLCLMLANYLSRPKDDPDMQAFFANWARQDPIQAERLLAFRGDGRFLVALADYGDGAHFDAMVLRAVDRACERDGFGDRFVTHYKEAARQLDDWAHRSQEGGPSGVYQDFMKVYQQLGAGQTLDGLRADLLNHMPDALDLFKRAYREAVGAEYTLRSDNLVDILQDLLRSKAFKDRYRGLVILADEFGYVLDGGRIGLDVFQRFTELCKTNIDDMTVAFIGTGHKVSLSAYAGRALSDSDVRVVSDRVTDVALHSEGIEDIISAIVIPNKSHSAWQESVVPRANVFNMLASDCRRIEIFKHLTTGKLRDRIIENIYPMHPMATHCVIQLAREVGSSVRSVFTFFSGQSNIVAEGSYPWYVQNTDILSSSGGLNLYTANLLVRYFKNELRPDNVEPRDTIRQHIRNYYASLKQAEDVAAVGLLPGIDDETQAILDIMLVYQIVGVQTSLENIKFGLNYQTTGEDSALRSRLSQLVTAQVLFLNPTTRQYEFRISGSNRDIAHMVEAQMANAEALIPDVIAAVIETGEALNRSHLLMAANNHNAPNEEDKRVLCVLAQPGTLETQEDGLDYFARLERELHKATAWNERYEGVAVYVLCETDSDIRRAQQAALGNHSSRVIVGIPRESIPVREHLLRVRAAQHIQQVENLNDWSQQEREELRRDFIGAPGQGPMGEFLNRRRRYLDGKELNWYTTNGTLLVSEPQFPYEPADLLMQRLYSRHNTQVHTDLNHIHVSRFKVGANTQLDEAIRLLMDTRRPLEIDSTAAANTGQRRYLQPLARAGVLDQARQASGALIPYRVNIDASRYSQTYPALAALIDRIKALKAGEQLKLQPVLMELSGAEYGQGPIALALFLAVAFRAFGDGLQLKYDPTVPGNVDVHSAEVVIGLVSGQNPNAVVEYRHISPDEQTLINGVCELFAEQPGTAGQDHLVVEAHAAMREWFGGQPNIGRAQATYPPAEFETTAALIQLLERADTLSPHAFVLDELQTVCGLDRRNAITPDNRIRILNGLAADKAAIEAGPGHIRAALIRQVMAYFHPASELYSDYQKAIDDWYRGLDRQQRDRYTYGDNRQVPALVEHLSSISDLERTLCDLIPRNIGFGLGAVNDWRSNRTIDYLRLFKAGLDAIAANQIKVEEPVWKTRGGNAKQHATDDGAQIVFRGKTTLTVTAPSADVRVYVTPHGDDPRHAEVQRQEVSQSWEMPVQRGQMVKLVSRNNDGAFSRVLTLSFINEDTKYEPQLLTQQQLLDQEYKFVFPKDREGLVVTIRSLLRQAIERKIISAHDLQELLDEIKNGLPPE